jgi:hypothetical protein
MIERLIPGSARAGGSSFSVPDFCVAASTADQTNVANDTAIVWQKEIDSSGLTVTSNAIGTLSSSNVYLMMAATRFDHTTNIRATVGFYDTVATAYVGEV